MRADGTVFPIELVIVQGERGGSTIFLAYMRDLTERRAAERALAEREEQFRTIAESVPIGLVISDLDTGRPLYINPQSRRNLEVGPDEKPDTLMHVWEKPEQRAALVREVVERGATRAFEVDLAMPSGRRMKALISATTHPLRRARGDAGGDRRHHRAARDRGGAAGEPEPLPRLHGLRAAGRAPARRRRAVPDVQPPHGGADRRAGGGGAGQDARRTSARRRGRQQRPAPPARWSRPASCTSASST